MSTENIIYLENILTEFNVTHMENISRTNENRHAPRVLTSVLYKSIIDVSIVLRQEFPIFTQNTTRPAGRIFRSEPRTLITLSFILRRRAFSLVSQRPRARIFCSRAICGPSPISNRINFCNTEYGRVNNQRDYRNRGPSCSPVSTGVGRAAAISLTYAGRCALIKTAIIGRDRRIR